MSAASGALLPSKKEEKRAKKEQRQQQLALQAPAVDEDMNNAMDLSDGAVGDGVGITLGGTCNASVDVSRRHLS